MGLSVVVAAGGQPAEELADAAEVQVDERVGSATAFRLRYAVDIHDDDLPALLDGRLGPGAEIMVSAPDRNQMACLVKGDVTGQHVALVHGGEGSVLEVRGSDTTARMDREERADVWPDSTDSDAASAILGRYGYTVDAARTDALHARDAHALVQRGTDLQFLRMLARRNGFALWASADANGRETAHFKPLDAAADADAELRINDASPTCERLDIEWDVDRPTAVDAAQLDLRSKNAFDPGATDPAALFGGLLGSQPLSSLADTRSLHLAPPTDTAADLHARANGALAEASWFMRARCSTTVEAVGAVVRAHRLVRVRGAGSRFSGRWLVAAVSHSIDAAAHRMELELVRNAWGADNGPGPFGAVAGLGA